MAWRSWFTVTCCDQSCGRSADAIGAAHALRARAAEEEWQWQDDGGHLGLCRCPAGGPDRPRDRPLRPGRPRRRAAAAASVGRWPERHGAVGRDRLVDRDRWARGLAGQPRRPAAAVRRGEVVAVRMVHHLQVLFEVHDNVSQLDQLSPEGGGRMVRRPDPIFHRLQPALSADPTGLCSLQLVLHPTQPALQLSDAVVDRPELVNKLVRGRPTPAAASHRHSRQVVL